MKNKLFYKIVFILSIILICLIILIIHNYNIKLNNSKQVVQQINKAKELDSYNSKVEKLKTKLQETNELLVLEGVTDISCTYDNSNVLDINDDRLSFLHRKFNEFQIRQLKVNNQYNFGFTYNLSNLQINKNDNKVNIILSDSNLNLRYITVNNDKTVLTDNVHLLASKFTPQEINEIMEITKVKTLNSIQSKSNIREKAIENTKKDIEDFAKELDVNIEVQTHMQGLVENNDSDITNVKFK